MMIGAALVAMVLAGVPVSPASAATWPPPVAEIGGRTITASTDDQTPFIGGEITSVTLDFTLARNTLWKFVARCADGKLQPYTLFSGEFNWTGVEEPRQTFTFPAASYAKEVQCYLDVQEADCYNCGRQLEYLFIIVPTNFKAARSLYDSTPMYSTVRDGYRDKYDLWIAGHTRFRASLRVYSSAGRLVYSRDVTSRDTGGFDEAGYTDYATLRWNGLTSSGAIAPVGNYTFKVFATSLFGTGRVRFSDQTIPVRSELRTLTKRVIRNGDTGTFGGRGKCGWDFYSYGTAALLNCVNDGYAQATYTIRVPSNASLVAWAVVGFRPGFDGRRGTITKRYDRPRSDLMRVRVRVTQTRSYVIDQVRVTYTYKKRY